MGEEWRRYRRCVNCKHKGEPCGLTNYIDKQYKRATMYRCRLHPQVMPFHFKTLACEDYEREA